MEGSLRVEGAEPPLQLYRGTVEPGWIDYNGHMTEGYYGVVFGDVSDELLLHVGFDEQYRHEVGGAFYTVETHIRFLQELEEADSLVADTQVLGADNKRVHLFHTLRREGEDSPAATQETLMLHVDTAEGVVTSMRSDVQAGLAELAQAHAALPDPPGAGDSVRPVPPSS